MHPTLFIAFAALLPIAVGIAIPAPASVKEVAQREEDRDDFYFFGISYDALIP